MKKLFIFIAVALSGGAGYQLGFTLSKKKYEKLADEEVASIKKILKARYEQPKKALPKDDEKVVKKTPKKKKKNEPIDSMVRPEKGGGIDYSKQYRSETDQRIPGDVSETMVKHIKEEVIDTTKPYVIDPITFGESEFQCVQLYYCADKVLTDDDYNQLDNIGIVGGHPNLEQMGKYDADCLYVRDEKKGIDYEILLEEREFSKLKPLGIVGE